jgi:predicted GIY-YIG superfamily endonuclease
MALSTMSSNTAVAQEIWQSLQQAISKSSGFKNWQKENKLNATIEEQVKQYLRSTLETLAY